MASEGVGQISSTYCHMMKEEVGRILPKDQIAGLLRLADKIYSLV
jgi:hypothetical protein